MPTPNAVLKKYWGHSGLRPAQEKAVSHVLKGEDVIALLPTGGGKSICFQVPALLKRGVCLVVSPLVSLMQDQVEGLQNKGIRAMMLRGYIPYNELNRLLDNCAYGNYKFLYLSPERLQNEIVQERLRHMDINLIAVDEAHCISEWGHDFRPAYREITVLRELKPDVNFIALTATATPRVLGDINTNLNLENAHIIRMSFARENIALRIKKTEDKTFELKRFLRENTGTSIIYVRSRKVTLNLQKFLNNNDIPARAYHGGMQTEQKEKLLQDWRAEKFRVMVATNAFGMGIDKSNVRNVIHYHLPDSLENYYQEVGRAGRDSRASKALLIYANPDILNLKNQFLKNAPTPENVKLVYKKLNAYFSIAYGEGQETEHNFNFLKFCQTYGFNSYLVYNILQFLDRVDVLSLSKEFHQRTELYFKIPNKRLYRFLGENKKYKGLIQPLLRMQGGFFDFKTPINLRALRQRAGMPRQKINTLLRELADLDVIDLTLADQDSTIVFLVPRENDLTINPLVPYIKQYYKNKKHKIDEMVGFVEDTQTCKPKRLLAYFGEEKTKDCGKCSVCLSNKKGSTTVSKKDLQDIRKKIRCLLKDRDYSSKDLSGLVNSPEELVVYIF